MTEPSLLNLNLASQVALFPFSQVHTDRTKFDVVVKAQGPQRQEVVWVPAIDTKTFCDLDYAYWPWDVQYCKYSVGSWTAFGDQVDVNMHRNVSQEPSNIELVMQAWPKGAQLSW